MRTPEEQDCILIVDDDPDQRTLLSIVLGHAGFRVVAAGGTREGFELARRERPDLIISDVVMPALSGIDLCRMIRAEEELRAIPILLLSAIDKSTDSMVEALQSGADGYVEISFGPHLLVARVARRSGGVRLHRAFRRPNGAGPIFVQSGQRRNTHAK
jgi:DNA-binding response OmpR family regulator